MPSSQVMPEVKAKEEEERKKREEERQLLHDLIQVSRPMPCQGSSAV